MLDLNKFFELQTKNKASTTKIDDDNFFITTKKFNPDTGEELASEVVGYKFSELTEKKQANLAENDLIDEFLALFN